MSERDVERGAIHTGLSARDDLKSLHCSGGPSKPRPTRNPNSIARWNNVGALDHKDYRSFGRARSMAHAFRHDEALSRCKIDYAVFEIDQEPPIKHKKEFIDVIMFVPVILALNDRHPHH